MPDDTRIVRYSQSSAYTCISSSWTNADGSGDHVMQELVEKYYSVNADLVGQALSQLRCESFVVQISNNSTSVWTFKHPTIADPLSEMLRNTREWGSYIFVVRALKISLQKLCAAAQTDVQDAVVIPTSLDDLLSGWPNLTMRQTEIGPYFSFFTAAQVMECYENLYNGIRRYLSVTRRNITI